MTKLDFMTDRVPLLGTILVGIATTAYLGASITPDLWSQIVMGIFAGALPLISVRFLIKKKVRFFWMTVGLIVFSDVSMVLSLTDGQSHGVEAAVSSEGEVPPALKRLQNDAGEAQATVNELLRQQAEAKTVAFVEMLQPQMTAAITSRDEAQKMVREWKPEESADVRVNSHDVFMAIPKAVVSMDLSRWMTLAYALIIAIVYQGTVIATTQATVKQVKASEPKTAPKRRKRRAKVATPPGETDPSPTMEPEAETPSEETEP